MKGRRELRDRFLLEMGKLDPWAAKLLKDDPLAHPKPKDREKDAPKDPDPPKRNPDPFKKEPDPFRKTDPAPQAAP
jgi:hypothetical protein